MAVDADILLTPRNQFLPYVKRQQRWASLVCHRRAGKTFSVLLDALLKAANHQRPGPPKRYGYLAPTRDQAKDVAWGYIQQFWGEVPGVTFNQAELMATLPCGTMLRLYSGDAFERVRGLYFDGFILDEFGDINPAAWHAVIRATLSDYRGWATFIGTPKGRNHFQEQHAAAELDPEWFTLTLRASDSGIIPAEELADIRKNTPKDIYDQEYECSFDVGRPGALFALLLANARKEGRISSDYQWRKELPVYAAFDVGAPANQRCVVFQVAGDRISILEGLEGAEDCATPADWAGRLRGRPYHWGGIGLPHDAVLRNGGQWDQGFIEAGLHQVVEIPKVRSVWDRVQTAQDAFPRCVFREDHCQGLIASLDNYHSKQESDGLSIRNKPVHDWSSHFSDAFGYACEMVEKGLTLDRSESFRPRRAIMAEPTYEPNPTRRRAIM